MGKQLYSWSVIVLTKLLINWNPIILLITGLPSNISKSPQEGIPTLANTFKHIDLKDTFNAQLPRFVRVPSHSNTCNLLSMKYLFTVAQWKTKLWLQSVMLPETFNKNYKLAKIFLSTKTLVLAFRSTIFQFCQSYSLVC